MTFTDKVVAKARSDGVSGLMRAVPSFSLAVILTRVFGHPAKRIVVSNGVAVRKAPLLVAEDYFPDHEDQLITSIRRHLQQDSDVVLIGAGSGASTVATARTVGKGGSVLALEAGDHQVEQCRDTLQLNEVSEMATCRQAVVETPIHVLSQFDGAPRMSAAELPEADALVMDCEGAEIDILKGLESFPETIIVETHTHFDADSDLVRELIPEEFTEIECLRRSEQIDVLTFQREAQNMSRTGDGSANRKVTLRPATLRDIDRIYEWRCQEPVYRWFKNQDGPLDWHAHVNWFTNRGEERSDQIIMHRSRPVGVVAIDAEGDVGIYLGETDMWGQGIASEALSKAVEERDDLVAEIHTENSASKRLFESCGFVEVGREGEWVQYELVN